MGHFNITNSKVDQLNDAGDNVKVGGTGNAVTVARQGDVSQVQGDQNRVMPPNPKSDGVLGKLGAWVAVAWKWVAAKFGFGSPA